MLGSHLSRQKKETWIRVLRMAELLERRTCHLVGLWWFWLIAVNQRMNVADSLETGCLHRPEGQIKEPVGLCTVVCTLQATEPRRRYLIRSRRNDLRNGRQSLSFRETRTHVCLCLHALCNVNYVISVKARTERRDWTELTRLSFWRTDQYASKTSLLVIGWRVRERSHIDHRRR